jgi:hypothetical protein
VGFTPDELTACAVIPMSMADEKYFCVFESKAKLVDTLFDHRDRRYETAVDEDVALRRGYEVGSKTLAADIVKVAHDPVRRERFRPGRVYLRDNQEGGSREKEHNEAQHPDRHCGLFY